MPNDWGFTNTWYDPYSNQWADLGFFTAESVAQDYGTLWFDYDDTESQMVEELGSIQLSHLEDNFDLWGKVKQNNLENTQRKNQLDSTFRTASAIRDKELNKIAHENDKKNLIQNAIFDLNKADTTIGQIGLVNSPGEVNRNRAVNEISDKITTANLSHNMKGRTSERALEAQNVESGYFDQENNWIAGLSEVSDEASYTSEYGIKEQDQQYSAEQIGIQIERSQQDIYEEWVIGNTNLVESMMRQQPFNENFSAILEAWNEEVGNPGFNIIEANTILQQNCIDTCPPQDTDCLYQCAGGIVDFMGEYSGYDDNYHDPWSEGNPMSDSSDWREFFITYSNYFDWSSWDTGDGG